MVTQSTIRQLLQRITDGEVRIPSFQREFVWSPDQVQFLMDSIYKGYPIGTVLFWRTKEKLQFDRDLGPYTLQEPKKEYPIDYVLDGQQRLTSIFATFQTDLQTNPTSLVGWTDIYFDLNANESAQDSQFIAIEPSEVKPHHVPLKVLFDVTAYGKLTRSLESEQAERIDELQTKFKEALIPVETVETEDHSKIAIIFERINRGGVPLDTYQLLSAWTWNSEFDLRRKFDELANDLDQPGYVELGEDADLLLKCCSTIIKKDASSRAVISLKGREVRLNFDKLRNGLFGAIDFLKRECGAKSFKILPYKTMIIPLCYFYATDKAAGIQPPKKQTDALKKWFWHSCFSRRYSNSVDTALSQDIALMQSLKANDFTEINKRAITINPHFFTSNVFSMNAVNTKVFILLLADKKPKSFLSGTNVDLETVLLSNNKTEYHHIFPRNYLIDKLNISDRKKQFMLANFAFLSQHDNRSIQDKAPAEYIKAMHTDSLNEIFDTAFITKEYFLGEYEDFVEDRAKLLANYAQSLVN